MRIFFLVITFCYGLYAHCEVLPNAKCDYKERGSRSVRDVHRIVRRNEAALRYAYNKRLKQNLYLPNSNVKVWISIDDSGTVFDCHIAHSKIKDTVFEQAIIRKIKHWNFGLSPVKGDTTSTMLTFTFVDASGMPIVETLLQTLLDHPRVKHFLHLELPERNPLYIGGDEMFLYHCDLIVDSQKVVFSPETENENTLFVKTLDFPQSDSCFIELFYPIEGARVKARFKNRNTVWSMVDISVVEN